MSAPIWLYWGNQPLSFLRFMTVYTLARHNPEVTLILRKLPQPAPGTWVEQEDRTEYRGEDWFHRITQLPNVKRVFLEDEFPAIAELRLPDTLTSDLLGWWLLGTEGGTISDMDVLYHAPVPEPAASVCLVQFSGLPREGYVPVTFMQSRPGSSWFLEVYHAAVENANPSIYESCGTHAITEVGLPSDWHRLPEQIVFPFSGLKPVTARMKTWRQSATLPSASIGLHWYAAQAQQWNNRVTGGNWDKWRNTVARLIGESGWSDWDTALDRGAA